MKRRILAILLTLAMAASMALTVTSCGKDTSLTVYAAGDFIKQDLINAFSEETGITVNYITGTRTPPKSEQPAGDTSAVSPDILESEAQNSVDILSEMRAWKQADHSAKEKDPEQGAVCDYDVILTDFDTASQLRDEECLRELTAEAIPNMKVIKKGWLGLNGETEHHYALPVLWGTACLLWNTKMLDYQVTSWRSLWRKSNKGTIVMPDNPRDCTGPVMMCRGFPVNSTNEKEIRRAYKSLRKQIPLVAGYSDGATYTMMENNAAAITVAYSGSALSMMANNPNLAYIIPKEGTWRICYTYSISAGTEWPTEAEKFVNYMCSASNLAKNAVYSKYSTTSVEAFKKLDKSWQKNPIAYPNQKVRQESRLIQGLDADSEALHAQLYQELMEAYNAASKQKNTDSKKAAPDQSSAAASADTSAEQSS